MGMTTRNRGPDWKTVCQWGKEGSMGLPPTQPGHVCVWGPSLWPLPSFLPSRHIPKEPSSPAFSLLAVAPTVPSSGNLPPHLVNHLCQKFHSAAILGSQEQHNMDVHSCDEFRFTFNSWGFEMTSRGRGAHLGIVHGLPSVLGEQGSILLRCVPAGTEPKVLADVFFWHLQQTEYHRAQVGDGHAIHG